MILKLQLGFPGIFVLHKTYIYIHTPYGNREANVTVNYSNFQSRAFAMYLFENQMNVALKEALRIVKPGGHLCLTHFVETGDWVEPIKKVQWSKLIEKYHYQDPSPPR